MGAEMPASGAVELTPEALADAAGRPLAAYVHIPYCASRCGYCDFNTYTAAELGPGSGPDAYLAALGAEIERGAAALGSRPLATVFFGGGTPTLLPAARLVAVLGRLREAFGLEPGAEVTTEANPESVDERFLAELRAGGFTRLSLGMQSARPHVLAALDRRHTPGRALEVVGWARAAGFDHVSLDLIYGTPGESLDDWRASLDAVLGTEVDHVSAYSLIVEQGTRLGAAVRRGLVPAPDEDDLADKYLLADAALTGAGLQNYEVSNWARPGGECRHNLAYWRSDPWWGFGAGAHSHVGGVRWWNVKHPRTYAERLGAGESPALGGETVDAEGRRVERVLLELRLAEGLDLGVLTVSERERVPDVVGRRLAVVAGERLRLTLAGRLLADAVIRDLLD